MSKYKIKNEAAGNIYVQYDGRQFLLMAGVAFEAEKELIGEGTRKLEKDGLVSIISIENEAPLERTPDAEELKERRAEERKQKDADEIEGKKLLEEEKVENTENTENNAEPEPAKEATQEKKDPKEGDTKEKDKKVEENPVTPVKNKKKKKGANQ